MAMEVGVTEANEQYAVYLEIGQKRTFAVAIDWPGWARSGRDKESALQALMDYASRYAYVLRHAGLEFKAPVDLSAFRVIERLQGNTTTDFGAPGMIPSGDHEPPDAAELKRLETILVACWQVFDAAVAAARDKDLRKGPRGGGRDLEEIVDHVLGAELGYLGAVRHKWDRGDRSNPAQVASDLHRSMLDVLFAAQGVAPLSGPRGGKRWPWRYFVRRVAWHALDHTWEIEDRTL
jgi:hypothetical protein